MARFKKDAEFDYELIDNYGIIEESPNSNWAIAFTKERFGNETGYGIRRYDVSTLDNEMPRIGKGVLIKDDGSMDELLYLLLRNGFGSNDVISDILKVRDSIYKTTKGSIEEIQDIKRKIQLNKKKG